MATVRGLEDLEWWVMGGIRGVLEVEEGR